MHNRPKERKQLQECAGYFEVPGACLYTVLHEVKAPVARVLLVGPFASERHNSYVPWVRWARFLAAQDIEVLRYDYRGIGESTGEFEKMTFAHWEEDVRLLYAWFAERSPRVPIILHGVGLGAVLAGRSFHDGSADALMLWSPPADANQTMRASILRWVGLEQIFKFGSEQKSASEHIQDIELGLPLEVDGYRWSGKLWKDSFRFVMPEVLASEESAALAYDRPVRIVNLTRDAAPLAKGGRVGYDDLKDFSWLFDPNCKWLIAAATNSVSGIAHA